MMVCIVMFLFSYVNSSMFWHGHNVRGSWFFHSHISSLAHRTANTDGGHTAAEFVLLEMTNQASFTEMAVPDLVLEPLRTVEALIVTPPVAHESHGPALHSSLRGPPVLV